MDDKRKARRCVALILDRIKDVILAEVIERGSWGELAMLADDMRAYSEELGNVAQAAKKEKKG